MIDTISAAIDADIPVLLWGAPGTGKTAAIRALATSRGARLTTMIGATLDPTDLVRPVMRRGHVDLDVAQWIRELRAGDWLFLDELSCSPPSVQAALLRLVHERAVAGYQLPAIRVLAAANPSDHAADYHSLSAAMSNRWAHLDWRPDLDAWLAGELGGWGGPPAPHRAVVCGYLTRNRGAWLSPPEHADDVRGWPSPRAWSMVARVAPHPDLVAGLVGPAAAREFAAWVAEQDLPDPADLLAGAVALPERGDRTYAALMSATAYAIEHDRLPALWSLCARARRDVGLGTARLGVAAAERAGRTVVMTPELQELLAWMRRAS